MSNTIEYTILDKKGIPVGRHSQNVMCLTCNDSLEKYTPAEDYDIQAWGYNDDDSDWEDKPENLAEWLKKNPAKYTHRNFLVDEKVKVSKRRGEAIVIEVLKGKWNNDYMVKLEDGSIIKVGQNEVMLLK